MFSLKVMNLNSAVIPISDRLFLFPRTALLHWHVPWRSLFQARKSRQILILASLSNLSVDRYRSCTSAWALIDLEVKLHWWNTAWRTLLNSTAHVCYYHYPTLVQPYIPLSHGFCQRRARRLDDLRHLALIIRDVLALLWPEARPDWSPRKAMARACGMKIATLSRWPQPR